MKFAIDALAGPRLRVALACGVIANCCAAIAAVFWIQDMRYSLPTPRPMGLEQPAFGTHADLPASIASLQREGRPLFLHFYRPGCPCSRFNLDHVRSLERQHAGEATFALVLEGEDARELDRAFANMDWAIPHVDDLDGSVAAALGVYSTPQAAIIDSAGRIAYRGNYNSSRYCVDANSEFARLALEDVQAGRCVRKLPAEATIAYGCSLPADLAQEQP